MVLAALGLAALTAATAAPDAQKATVQAQVKASSTVKTTGDKSNGEGTSKTPTAAAPSVTRPVEPGTTPIPVVVDIDKPSGGGDETTPDADTRYSVLMDVPSGKILWSRNPDTHREIASTTKVLTAILLIEKGKQSDLVVGPPGVDKIEESSLHLSPGETITLHDLLYAMLLRSANDTAVAGADYLAGSVPAFAAMMNEKAKEIGATNSHFVTPNGLYDPNHYSCAEDMAKIARYALLNLPEFDQIVRTQNYKVQRSVHKDDCWVKNTSSKFLKEFPGADGVKTGFISQAGHCFIGSATRNDWRMIAVALDSDHCREDVESILNYGFHNWRRVQVMHKDDAAGSVDVPGAAQPAAVEAAADFVTPVSRWKPDPSFSYRLTPVSPMPTAPVAEGTKLGTITVLAGESVQGTIDAVASDNVAAKPAAAASIAPHLPAGNGFLRGLTKFLAAVALVILGGRIYARTVAKGSGGSRDRVTTQL